MARHVQQRDLGPILAAARTWINDSLIADRSLFGAGELWTPALVEEVRTAFVDHPDESNDKFMVKLVRQMQPASKAAKRLTGECLWALFLFPSNMKAATKRVQIAEAWAWSGESLSLDHPMLTDTVLRGIGSGGQAFHSLRYRELAYMLGLVKQLKALEPAERVKVFSDYDAFLFWLDSVPREGNRQFRHMLRYFSFPDRVERMSSNYERRQVLEGFRVASAAELRRWDDRQLDEALLELRRRLEAENPGRPLDFYEAPLESVWREPSTEPEGEDEGAHEPDVETAEESEPAVPAREVRSDALKPRNLILYGPPGTGKTHWLRKTCEDYTDRSAAIDEETWLQEKLSAHGWRPLIAAVIANRGGSARVSEIREHKWFAAKMRQRGRSPETAGAAVWGTLQTHAPMDDPNVGYGQRRAPFIFRKGEGAHWTLVPNWRELDDEADVLETTLRAGATAATSPVRRFRVVTFHPSFSYEDFIRGIRPVQDEEGGATQFRLVDGVFKQACDEARANPAKRYAFFIDEINRANIAKVFGELITLIEPDKRAVYDSDGRLISGMVVQLPGGEGAESADPPFGVPANLDIFGTMNTADRSIALLDIALRRRFEFRELEPDYTHIDKEVATVHLGRLLRRINDRLEFLLDRDHRIGHAYLMSVQHLTDLRAAFRLKVIPLLQEYFFDDFSKVASVLATSPDAPPFLEREALAFDALFPGPRSGGLARTRDRYVITDEPTWTEATFRGIYESGPTNGGIEEGE